MSIPASNLVTVNPGVLSAGGNPLAFNGVVLSHYANLRYGAPTSFPSYLAVAAFFGATSIKAKMAQVYFSGFINATQLPKAMFFTRYPTTAIAAFMNGGSSSTLDQLKLATAGQLSISIDGVSSVIDTISLASYSSLAAMAAALTSALTPNGGSAVISYNTTLAAFVVTSGTIGVLSTIAFATSTGTGVNNLAAALGLTSATGASLSQGAALTDPTTFMNVLIGYTQNWVDFTTTFLPSSADMEAFALWTASTNGRYMYVPWDNDATAAGSPGTFTGFGKWLATNKPSGTCPVWAGASPDVTDGPLLAAFVLGLTASINFQAKNGRVNYAFKGNDLLTPTVTDATIAANLQSNGYNFYGEYATANQDFLFFNNGQISGRYLWADAYVDAIWLNNALQLSLMSLFGSTNSLPYDQDGYTMVEAAAQGPITQGLNNGVIRTGVALSPSQVAIANSQAGTDISVPLQNNGYYFQVVPVTDPVVRAARTSPVCSLWYTDGGSIQQLTLASIDVQ